MGKGGVRTAIDFISTSFEILKHWEKAGAMTTTLFCAFVGTKGEAFPMEVTDTMSVGALKQAIKKEKPDLIACDLDELHIYLAKKVGSSISWLKDDDEASAELESGNVSRVVNTMIEGADAPLKATHGVLQCLREATMPPPGLDEIHLLLVNTNPMLVLFCHVVGELGNPFPVEVNSKGLVATLARAIKDQKTLECDANQLHLFLAHHDQRWLKSDSDDAHSLRMGARSGGLADIMTNEMPATWVIQDWINEKNLPPMPARCIHVLVEVPKKREGGNEDEEDKEEEEDSDDEGSFCINEMRWTKRPCICEQYRAATGRG